MLMIQERKLLQEIREMAAMDKSAIAEKYHQPIDNADDYFKTKTCAVLDVIIDDLNYEIQREQDQKHYKGTAGLSPEIG